MSVDHLTQDKLKYVLDSDADPYIPKGWRVVEHKKGGKWEWDPRRIKLYLSDKQQGLQRILGSELRKEVEDLPVLNANAIDFLISNFELISNDWRGKAICFWGTIFLDENGNPCIRLIYWDGVLWLPAFYAISEAGLGDPEVYGSLGFNHEFCSADAAICLTD